MAEHSLCVVVARLRRSPAVSREDCGGAERLHSTDEVCFTVCARVCAYVRVCVCRGACLNQMFLWPLTTLIHTSKFHAEKIIFFLPCIHLSVAK